MKWGLWSTTAGSNSAAPPDGWPEGMLPSTVNDAAREMMASIRTAVNDIQFIDLGVTPTQTGNTTFTLAGNQMQWYQYGNRVKANVGGTLMYGTVISSSFTTNTGVTLRMDLGDAALLTGSLSAVSTGFPSAVNGALPEVVYRNRNYIHNPYMDVWQRGNGPFSQSNGANALITADRWGTPFTVASAGCTISITRSERSANASNVPTLAQCGVLLNSSVCISVNNALATVAAGDFIRFGQSIEGYNFRNLANKPMTLSFWVNSTTTGTYCMSVGNIVDRSYVAPFSISSVSTWEKKTFTIPESPSAGTWDYSSGIGLAVRVVLVCGSGAQTTNAGQWTATVALATSAQINFCAATGRSIRFAAWSLREGNQEIPLEPIDFEEDLAHCQRYYHNYPLLQTGGYQTTGNTIANSYTLSPPMRATPVGIAVSISSIINTTGIAIGTAFEADSFQVNWIQSATGAYLINFAAAVSAEI